jgi:hypothetical protein
LGSLTIVNAALATLTYIPTANYNGSAAVSIATDDGNGGAGCIVDDDDRPLHILGSGGGGPGFLPRQPLGASGVRVTARLFHGGQLLFEGRFGGHLQRQINRGVNPQAAVLFIFGIKH